MTVADYIRARKETELDFRSRAAEIARRLAITDQCMRFAVAESLIPFDDPNFEHIPRGDINEAILYLTNHRNQLVMAARALSKKAHQFKIDLNLTGDTE